MTLFGASLRRLEDPRLLRGQATFVEDLRLPGLRHVAFVRSVHAHARFRLDSGAVADGAAVYTAADFPSITAIPTVISHEALRLCAHPPLARDRARYVGDPRAVVADSRYVAEDAAADVRVEYDVLGAIADADAALRPDAPLLHEGAPGNVAADFTVRVGDADGAFAAAEIVTRGRYSVQRYTGMPLETRGVAAEYDAGTGRLTVWSSTQWPHTLRDVLRGALGLPEHRIRVVAPDVGGGFGVKQEIYPEEIVLAVLAMREGTPVKWVETRREHVTTAAHAREQRHDVELAERREGPVVGRRGDEGHVRGTYA